jgi:hypothetical protein
VSVSSLAASVGDYSGGTRKWKGGLSVLLSTDQGVVQQRLRHLQISLEGR